MDEDFMYDDDEFDFDEEFSTGYEEDEFKIAQEESTFATNKLENNKKKFEIDYKIVSEDDLRDMQKKLIGMVCSVSKLSDMEAQILLRVYRWNAEKVIELLFENPEEAYKEAGIADSIGKPLPKTPTSNKKITCFICCDDVALRNTLTLACSETFCKNCHRQYLEQKIAEEGKVRKIVCPGTCGTYFPDSIVKEIISEKTAKKFEDLLIKLFVIDSKKLHWCPAPDCLYAIFSEETNSTFKVKVPVVKCKCEESFCLTCPNGDHTPCLCSITKLWIRKCADDSETSNWIKANTKECPACHSTIEKNGGCNHMTCKKCNYEFCWTCMSDWKKHGADAYNCSRFQAGEAEDEKSKSRISLERYLHYFNRYANHQLSANLDQELYRRIELMMEETQKQTNMSWIEVLFLKDAVNTLTKSRQVLKWTYALCYYLNQDNFTYILEDIQQDLELATEALSGMLEEPIERETIPSLKQRVLDKTSYVNLRYEVLIEDIYQGYRENRWKYNATVES